jgi:hypothetical protein
MDRGLTSFLESGYRLLHGRVRTSLAALLPIQGPRGRDHALEPVRLPRLSCTLRVVRGVEADSYLS